MDGFRGADTSEVCVSLISGIGEGMFAKTNLKLENLDTSNKEVNNQTYPVLLLCGRSASTDTANQQVVLRME
ncbi:hypothetical protein J21TS3_46670 [Paenibacillus cookii]|uniref:Uncharacterized protein n=1 Tax=Paenibacillus cookii TaxID=157839 RepID=A0ABQ4M2S9_9BACL|nr:hypothetical protein J21TS3_46670 [Paenibacillus cookii]